MLRKPIRMDKVGSWIEQDIDAYLQLDGLTWLRVQGGFGDGQKTDWHPREDWIALVPALSLNVNRTFVSPEKWNHGATSIHEAMRREVSASLASAHFEVLRVERRLDRLHRGVGMLRASADVRV